MSTTRPATASTSCSSASRPTYPSLPREIRLHILRQTHLLRNFDWAWEPRASGAGATILNGKLLKPPPSRSNKCKNCDPSRRIWWCNACQAGYLIPFPVALFTVSKQIYEDAQEVFWSQRFVLKGDFEKSKSWLEGLPRSHVQQIRKLDLILDTRRIRTLGCKGRRGYDHGFEEVEGGWKLLIQLIRQRMRLDRLHLSLDAGEDSASIEEYVRHPDEYYPMLWLKPAYIRILAPLAQELKGKLQNFHLFLCWGVEAEAEDIAERMILEEGDRTLKEGKVDYYERDKRNPHWKVLAEEGEENKRTLTGLEKVRRSEVVDERDLEWLRSL